jgi:L-2-amino-thiazoline-4-carboxylic acid hydrolase
MTLAFASFAKGDALDYSVRAQSEDTFEIDVTRCRYAQFYKELGEPELGFLLVCSSDFPFAEGLGPDIKLTRAQTIMQGARATVIFATSGKKTDRFQSAPKNCTPNSRPYLLPRTSCAGSPLPQLAVVRNRSVGGERHYPICPTRSTRAA